MGNNLSAEERDAELSSAAEKGKVQIVETLLKKGADPNKRIVDDESKARTSLHRAAKTKNNVNVLTKLLDHVKDVDATDEDGNTALHLAAGYYNNASVVQTLLHARPNCKIQNDLGETALHSAVKGGSDLKIIESLLMADSDPNISDVEGNTSLHKCASRRGIDPMIPGMLLRFGANPNLKNEQGETTLHIASRTGNKAVLLLLKFHAKVRLKNKEGKKASEIAATEEIKHILEWEEKQLEERTIRCESTNPQMLSRASSRTSYTSDTGSGQHNNYYYSRSGGVFPPSHPSRSSDFDPHWKGSGGDGVIHLPDKSDIVVPPQAVPFGTTFEVKIAPAHRPETDDVEVPDFDFDMFDFEFDVKVELPGVLFVAPWMSHAVDERSPTPFSVNASSSPAFTGMCMEGRNRWKSIRELASQSDGILALRFKLSREKSQPLSYKIPLPSRRSTTEIELMRSPRSINVIRSDGDLVDSKIADSEATYSRHESSSASSSDDDELVDIKGTSSHSEDERSSSGAEQEMRQDEFQEPDDWNLQQSSHDDFNKESTAASLDKLAGEEEECDLRAVSRDFEAEKQESGEDDIYIKLNDVPYTWEADYEHNQSNYDNSDMRYDHHPIDPALATICEESQSDTSERMMTTELNESGSSKSEAGDQQESDHVVAGAIPDREQEELSLKLRDSDYDPDYISSTVRSNTYEQGYDLTLDDVDSFSRATRDQQVLSPNRVMEENFSATDGISRPLFM